MERCDAKVVAHVKSTLLNPPCEDLLYIWAVPENTVLPEGVHVTRDEVWKKGEAAPHGHQLFDAARNFETGEQYVQKLEELNAKAVLVAELKYSIRSDCVEEEECLVRRTETNWIGVEGEKWRKDTKKFVKVVYAE